MEKIIELRMTYEPLLSVHWKTIRLQ